VEAAAAAGSLFHQNNVAVLFMTSTPAGVMDTRFSSALISLRIPTIILFSFDKETE
jgi:hypothetical protein